MTRPGGRMRPDRVQLGGRIQTGTWGRDAVEASIDRDDAAHAAQAARPSTSTVPRRCATCRQWGAGTGGFCASCGDVWSPLALVGLPPMR